MVHVPLASKLFFVQAIYDPVYLPAPWYERNARLNFEVPRCISGSWGADFYGVAPLEGEVVVRKHRYSAFVNTELDLILRRPPDTDRHHDRRSHPISASSRLLATLLCGITTLCSRTTLRQPTLARATSGGAYEHLDRIWCCHQGSTKFLTRGRNMPATSKAGRGRDMSEYRTARFCIWLARQVACFAMLSFWLSTSSFAATAVRLNEVIRSIFYAPQYVAPAHWSL